MKNMKSSRVGVVALAGVFLLVGANVSVATPADPAKGTGCIVTDANEDQYFDASCRNHSVLKLNDDGSLAFYRYHDIGQLPEGAALPTEAITRSFELCLNFGPSIGVKCGTVDEVVTPNGLYRSSFAVD